MATDTARLLPVSDCGWRMGLANFLAKENGRWWKTRLWLVQTVLWLFLVNGVLASILFTPSDEGGSAALSWDLAVVVFFVNAGILPAIGASIVMQDSIIEEKRSGTAAWALSKPLSRAAFILSKLIANSLGFFVTAVLIPGFVAYWLFALVPGRALGSADLALAMGMVALFQLFCLTLTLTLGTLFDGRGPVIGLSLLIVGAQYYLLNVPGLASLLPVSMVLPADQEPNIVPSLAARVAAGQSLPSVLPILATVVWIALLLAFAFSRFQREEF